MKTRYKIEIEYDGTDFCGWQRQRNGISIQESIEDAITKFSFENTKVVGSGRTDAGVHAVNQVGHFDLDKKFDSEVIVRAINHFLKPRKIGILNCQIVEQDFHARFSAINRSYVYRIINRKSVVVMDKSRCWWVKNELNLENIICASKYLVGKHDFTSFRASCCQAKSPFRTVNSINIEKIASYDEIRVVISARSFLHHMVRNIVGTLIMDFGIKNTEPNKMKSIIDSKLRQNAGVTAPACGLYFLGADYI